MLSISPLNGEESGRLHEVVHGRTDAAFFRFDVNGRVLVVYVMTEAVAASLHAQPEGAPPAPDDAADAYVPPAPKPVKIRTM